MKDRNRQIARDYSREEVSQADLAQRYGVYERTVQRVLQKSGVTMREPGTKTLQQHLCLICGKEFQDRHEHTKCCAKCRGKHHTEYVRKYRWEQYIERAKERDPRTCPECSVKFVPIINPHRKYCKSSNCRATRRNIWHERMAGSMRNAIEAWQSGHKWEEWVNYNFKQLVHHLEQQWIAHMSWQNYGSTWHIDHIRPVASFGYISPEYDDWLKCWGLNNLQPLWAKENIKKGAQWDGQTKLFC